MKTFFSYSHLDSAIALQIASLCVRSIAPDPQDQLFCYSDQQRADESFMSTIGTALSEADSMVILVGKNFSEYQVLETNAALSKQCEGNAVNIVLVTLLDEQGNRPAIPSKISLAGQCPRLDIRNDADYDELNRCAERIVNALGARWRSWDDLPSNPHLFSYEKDIVKFFRDLKQVTDLDNASEYIRERILQGCPLEWPELRFWPGTTLNRLDQEKVGKWRSDKDRVDVVASSRLRAEVGSGESSFLEAGPRERLRFPKAGPTDLRVGILISGGIAPGINAVIDGIVQRHYDYAEANFHVDRLQIWGIQNGFLGTEYLPGAARRLVRRRAEMRGQTDIVTCEHAHEGGSIIGTSRLDTLLHGPDRKARFERLATTISQWADILYVIGGDGTMKAAHALWNVANGGGQKQELSVVAVPKTMDNDILWMWQSFGFLSAVEKAREVVEQLSTEVESNPRLCVVQLFGSDSGFVVSHAVLASATGHCTAALIPEADFTMTGLAEHIASKITETDRRVPYALVVMAETAVPLDAEEFIDKKYIGLTEEEKKSAGDFCRFRALGRRIQGQTADSLRTAALKIVSRGLKEILPQAYVTSKMAKPDWRLLRLVTNEPRHILRSTPPSTSDIITGHRLGTSAVDAAMAGYTDAMISQWLTEYVIVPLKLVVLGRKRIPHEGIFWKSVLAKTGQPADLSAGRSATAAHH